MLCQSVFPCWYVLLLTTDALEGLQNDNKLAFLLLDLLVRTPADQAEVLTAAACFG